uniref:SERPIN domain-containing protein n=1 Tax=Globodera pallida TaxID=36090 RepID=A0A183CU57_GLOPA
LDVMTLTLTPITPITAFFSAVMTDDVDAVTGIFA